MFSSRVFQLFVAVAVFTSAFPANAGSSQAARVVFKTAEEAYERAAELAKLMGFKDIKDVNRAMRDPTIAKRLMNTQAGDMFLDAQYQYKAFKEARAYEVSLQHMLRRGEASAATNDNVSVSEFLGGLRNEAHAHNMALDEYLSTRGISPAPMHSGTSLSYSERADIYWRNRGARGQAPVRNDTHPSFFEGSGAQ